MKTLADRIRSTYLRNRRTVWVRKPKDPSVSCPLIVFLDGEFYRERMPTNAIIDRLQRQRRMGDAWVVYVSRQSFKARSRECPCYPPFAKFIARELLPWLEGRHPEIRQATKRVLAGLSYSGLAAAYVAIVERGLFDSVVCQSGSFWWNDFWLPRSYARRKRTTRAAFYLDVGKKEIKEDADQVEGIRRLRDALRRKGNRVKYVEFNGGHEFKGWARTLPAALVWAAA